MSLATRCTSCGTIFRVVQDQLKVSDGWVRCGRCNEVFNAMEGLFDLQRDGAPRPRSASATRPAPLAEAPRPAPAPRSRPAPLAPVDEEPALGDTAVAKVMHELATQENGTITKSGGGGSGGSSRPAPRPKGSTPAGPPWRDAEDENVSILPADDLHPAFADATFPESVVAGAEPAETLPAATETGPLESETARQRPPSRSRSSSRSSSSRSSSRSSRSRSGSSSSSRSRSSPPPAPGFVQKAAREARWRQPWVRATLAVSVLVLNLTLATQMAYQWRDRLAVQWPSLRPVLGALCSTLDCELQPPRVLDAIVVESTTLTKLDGVAEGYRLTVVLRNRATFEVRLPSLDLSLTDADGIVVVRRALAPDEFRSRPPALPAQAETALQMAMIIEGQRVSGYTVAAFYP